MKIDELIEAPDALEHGILGEPHGDVHGDGAHVSGEGDEGLDLRARRRRTVKCYLDASRGGRRVGFSALCGFSILLAAFSTVSGCETSKPEGRHAIAPITLSESNLAHQSLYVARCDQCHDEMPDPSEPYCFSGVSGEEHLAIWEYEMAMLNGDVDHAGPGKLLFESACVGCHDLPDPAQAGCFSGVAAEDVIPLHVYMDDSRRGRDLFARDCRSCHADLDPAAHDFGFWSAHLCNADEHLTAREEQDLLLYLSVRAKEPEARG